MLAAVVAQTQQVPAPWPFRDITLDPAQTRGLAWLLVLIVGAIVALSVGPGVLLRKAWTGVLWPLLHKFLRALVRIGVEIAAWLGYEGKRLVFVVAYLALILFATLTLPHGETVGMKFIILGLFIAWSSPHRRRMRQRRQLRGIETQLDRIETKLGEQVASMGRAFKQRWWPGHQPQPAPATPGPAPGPAPGPGPCGPYNWQSPTQPGGPVYAPSSPPPARPAPAATAGAARRRRGGGYRGPGRP